MKELRTSAPKRLLITEDLPSQRLPLLPDSPCDPRSIAAYPSFLTGYQQTPRSLGDRRFLSECKDPAEVFDLNWDDQAFQDIYADLAWVQSPTFGGRHLSPVSTRFSKVWNGSI